MLIGALSSFSAEATSSFPPLGENREHFENREILLDWISRQSPFHAVAFSPLGELLATGSADGAIQLWNVAQGNQMRRLEGHLSGLNSIAFSPDGTILASGSVDQTVRLWNVSGEREEVSLEGHSDEVSAVAFSPDGRVLASASLDGSVLLWDIARRAEIARIERLGTDIFSVAFSFDHENFAMGAGDGTVRLWDLANATEVGRLEGHEDVVRSVTFSPDGTLLASGSEDGTVRLWDPVSTKEIALLDGHTSAVLAVAFNPTGSLLGSSSADRSIRLWDVDRRVWLARFEGHSDWVGSIAFSPLGGILASASEDRTVRMWNVDEGTELRRLQGHACAVPAVAFSPAGSTLAAASADGTVRLWDAARGEEIGRLEGHTSLVRSLAFSPDGLTLASASVDRAQLWDVDQTTEIGSFEGHAPLAVAFSPDGTILAAGLASGQVLHWDVQRGVETARFQGQPAMVRAVAFSSDGALLAVGSVDGMIRLWDMARGAEIVTLRGHTGAIFSLGFHPRDHTLVSASEDRTVRLWQTGPGQGLGTFPWSALPLALAISPDGSTLAVAGDDGRVHLWDLLRRREIQRLEGHAAEVLSVSFSADGTMLASGSADRTIRLWSKIATGSYHLSHQLLGGQRGTWIGCRSDGSCLRADDGTLLLRRDDQGLLWPVPPQLGGGHPRLELVSAPTAIETVDGRATPFILKVKNIGPGSAFWLNVHEVQNETSEQLVFHPPPAQLMLGPGDVLELPCRVSAHTRYEAPVEQSYSLTLEISSAHEVTLSVPPIAIHGKAPSLAWREARWLRDGRQSSLVVKLANTGALDLSETELGIEVPGLDTATLAKVIEPGIPAGAEATISFALPPGFKLSKADRVSLRAHKLDSPIHRWAFRSQPVVPPPSRWPFVLVVLSFSFICLAALSVFQHPLVTEHSKHPERLLTLPLPELARARQLLRLTGRLRHVLIKAKVDRTWLDQATTFAAERSSESRCRLLGERLGVSAEGPRDAEGWLWALPLGVTFPLNLPRCYLYLPAETRPADDVVKVLKQLGLNQVTLVLSANVEHQEKLHRMAEDPANLWVAPDQAQLTSLWLAADPMAILARIMALQVSLERISPYQTHEGVEKESIFFGRRQVLAHILNRDPSNYLVVGARQIGKSSLLKAIDRHYQGDPRVRCHYLVLGHQSDEQELIARLARALGLDLRSNVEDLHAAVRSEGSVRQLFLIDEADSFIQADRRSGHSALAWMRGLSAEGYCHFIMAGFWTLYEAAVLDFQSPIRNFGEVLKLGALEPEACRDLAIQPMATMGLGYTSSALVEQLIERTGHRANLISIGCNEMLKGISPKEKTIGADAVSQALKSAAIDEALEGWKELLGPGKPSNRLDRIVVYATIERVKFTQVEVLDRLEELGVATPPEQVERSLRRLELAFVLRREQACYNYTVPLFKEKITALGPERLLEYELVQT